MDGNDCQRRANYNPPWIDGRARDNPAHTLLASINRINSQSAADTHGTHRFAAGLQKVKKKIQKQPFSLSLCMLMDRPNLIQRRWKRLQFFVRKTFCVYVSRRGYFSFSPRRRAGGCFLRARKKSGRIIKSGY